MTEFFKYHGLGNDFIVVERDRDEWAANRVRRMCHRRRGIGADGLLVVTPPSASTAEGGMTLYNADGTRPEMCGNGIRCVVRHLVEHCGVDPDGTVVVETDDGPRSCRVETVRDEDWRVAVDMGPARVDETRLVRAVDGAERTFHAVDVGNPHAVTFEMAAPETVDAFGRALNEDEEAFPAGVNVEFVDVHSPRTLEVVVYERGVGQTRACGTGACATAAAAWVAGHAERGEPVDVELPGGVLEIERDEDDSIWMTGPASAVFRGMYRE